MLLLSEDQLHAAEGAIRKLRAQDHGTSRLAGSAGTGKTTVLAEIEAQVPLVKILAPTNKAAAVLRSKGVPATTIHSQIYSPLQVALKEDLKAATEALKALGDDQHEQQKKLEAEIRNLELQIRETPDADRLEFHFRPDNNLAGRPVIVDEASMVGDRVVTDLQRSNPSGLLLCGDTAQLPPIQDTDAFRAFPPDWTLTTQHRTGPGSTLAQFAQRIRTEGPARALLEPPHDTVSIVDAHDTQTIDNLQGDAILCWRNRTRHRQNARERILHNRDGTLQVGEPLVAYQRDDEKGRWYNGSEATVHSVEPQEIELFHSRRTTPALLCQLRIDGSEEPVRTPIAVADLQTPQGNGRYRPTWQFGYARTVHKAQGSEWDHVVVFDEYDPERGAYPEWIYTAVTRARKHLTIIR